jgi:hypothetical protein
MTTTQHSRLLNDYDIMDCIEEGLNKFGPGIKYAVMWRMVVQGASPKEGILANPQAFVSALRSIFGRSAQMIEQEILEQIKNKADNQYSELSSFTELVNALRKQNMCAPFMQQEKTQKKRERKNFRQDIIPLGPF